MSWSDSGGLVPIVAFDPYVEIHVVASSPNAVQLVVGLTSQQVSSWLKFVAPANMLSMVVADDVSQDEISGLNVLSWKTAEKSLIPVVQIFSKPSSVVAAVKSATLV